MTHKQTYVRVCLKPNVWWCVALLPLVHLQIGDIPRKAFRIQQIHFGAIFISSQVYRDVTNQKGGAAFNLNMKQRES